jgi:hypothetical protein
MHALLSLQKKIYQLLEEDDEITSDYKCRVFDHVPDNVGYPFIVIGDDSFDDFSSHTTDGFAVTMTIHTWTQGEGKKRCKEIQSRIYEIIHKADLELAGQKTVSLRAGLTTTILDPDGRTYHGVNVFNLLLGG